MVASRNSHGLFLILSFVWAGCTSEVMPIADYGEAGEGLAAAYCTPRDEYFVVWHDSVFLTTGGKEIRAITLSPAGEVLTPKWTILTTANSIEPFPMEILFHDEQEHYLVVWTESDYSVMGCFVSIDGLAGNPFRVGTGWVRDLVYNPQTREYVVAMAAPLFFGDPAMGQRLSLAGSPVDDPFAISRGGESDAFSRLAFNPETNEYMAVSSFDIGAGRSEVYGRIQRSDGSPAGQWFTIMSFPEYLDNLFTNRIQAAYLGAGGNYVVFVQCDRRVGSLPVQQTYGQMVSPSGDLMGGPYVVHTDLSSLVTYPSPPPALVTSPENGHNCLVFDALDGVLSAQPLTEMGIPDGALRTLALTYLVEGDVEIGQVDHVKVIANPNAPTGLALWTRFMPPLWDMALFGLIVDLD